ncbi:hypothetical protein Emed_000030 [Eimeria media]
MGASLSKPKVVGGNSLGENQSATFDARKFESAWRPLNKQSGQSPINVGLRAATGATPCWGLGGEVLGTYPPAVNEDMVMGSANVLYSRKREELRRAGSSSLLGLVPFPTSRNLGFLNDPQVESDLTYGGSWASTLPTGQTMPCEVLRLRAETAEGLARELQRIIYQEQRRGDALQATVEQGKVLLREYELLADELTTVKGLLETREKEMNNLKAILEENSRELVEKQAALDRLQQMVLEKDAHVLERDALLTQLRKELLETKSKASSNEQLQQQTQFLTQRLEALSKENLLLVGYKRKAQSLEDDLEEAKTVIEVLKIQVEANKTIKPFNSPAESGILVPPVGVTPSTQSCRTASYNRGTK